MQMQVDHAWDEQGNRAALRRQILQDLANDAVLDADARMGKPARGRPEPLGTERDPHIRKAP